jgi:hypothetical protein
LTVRSRRDAGLLAEYARKVVAVVEAALGRNFINRKVGVVEQNNRLIDAPLLNVLLHRTIHALPEEPRKGVGSQIGQCAQGFVIQGFVQILVDIPDNFQNAVVGFGLLPQERRNLLKCR